MPVFPRAEIDQAVAFLESFIEKRKRLGEEAFAVLMAVIAEFKLKRAVARSDLDARTADIEAVKAALDTAKQTIDAQPEVDATVNGAYYHASAEFFRVRVQ